MNTPKNLQRDISHFLLLRLARQEEDRVIGDLLLRSFDQTYRLKLPHIVSNMARKIELLDVESRRREGLVYVLELGHRIIGTFALIFPESKSSQSWTPGVANLRCLAIDPDFHGYGFSQLLLDEAERIAKNWNARGIALHVQKGASGVARLYLRNGFKREDKGDMSSLGSEIEAYFKDFYEHEPLCLVENEKENFSVREQNA